MSLDHRTQGTQAKIEAAKTLVDTTWRGLEAKIVEVTDDFLEGLETARLEFKMQLAEVEAQDAREFNEYSTTKPWAECESYQRTGTAAGMAQTPKFDGSTLWAVFRQQLKTMAEHNGWTPATRLHIL
jgi:hypothetical protein